MRAVLAAFKREIICERVKAGFAQARANGKVLERPPAASKKEKEVKKYSQQD